MRVLMTLFLLCLIVAPAQGQLKAMCGDCNLDMSVNISDALLAMQAAVGNITLPPASAPLCDVDSSGGPTTTDGLLILQFASGLVPTLTCPPMPPAVSPNSIIEPAIAVFGTCVQGQSSGNPWNFTILGNMGFPSGTAAAVPSGSSAFALATQWVTTINSPAFPGYVAIPTAGNCFLVQDTAGAAASIQLGNCVADTGTACPF